MELRRKEEDERKESAPTEREKKVQMSVLLKVHFMAHAPVPPIAVSISVSFLSALDSLRGTLNFKKRRCPVNSRFLKTCVFVFVMVAGNLVAREVGQSNFVIKQLGRSAALFEFEWTPHDPILALNVADMLLDTAERVLVLGQTERSGRRALVLVRYLPNDTIDPSFGAEGVIYLDSPGDTDISPTLILHKESLEVIDTFCGDLEACFERHSSLSRKGILKSSWNEEKDPMDLGL